MNPWLRKEARMVLPVWVLALVLATVPVWLLWPLPFWGPLPPPGPVVYLPFAAGLLLLAVTPFGQELSTGMFSLLLAQPTDRRRLWAFKAGILAAAVGSVFLALFFSVRIRADAVLNAATDPEWQRVFGRGAWSTEEFHRMIAAACQATVREALWWGGIIALAGFSGGLWTTLLFRQLNTALWFTLLVPLGIALAISPVLAWISEPSVAAGVFVAIAAYALGGFVWARRLFLRAEDTQWTGGIISLPIKTAPVTRATPAPRPWSPARMLWAKELQFQQANLLIAVGILVTHVAVILVRLIGRDYLTAHQSLQFMLESFPMVWLALPLVAGSTAIAEERKLGTLTETLCLPVSRRKQYSIKLAVALLLGGGLGGLLPAAIEALGVAAGLRPDRVGLFMLQQLLSTSAILFTGSLVLTLIAFYASSLSQNTLGSIGLAIAGCISCACLIVIGTQPVRIAGVPLWGTGFVAAIGIPGMVTALLWLAYRNFKHLHLAGPLWRLNLAILGSIPLAVLLVSSLTYHRVWELWLPPEPVRDPYGRSAFLASHPGGAEATPAKLESGWFIAAALLPDGRLWLQFRAPPRVEPDLILTESWSTPLRSGPWKAQFIAGSDWKDVAVGDAGVFALKQDGGLWRVAEGPVPGSAGKVRLERLDPGSTYAQIDGRKNRWVGLKSDGTVWEWGQLLRTVENGLAHTNTAQPVAVSSEADWIAVCGDEQSGAALKRDGRFWRWGWVQDRDEAGKLQGRLVLEPEPWLKWSGPAPVWFALRSGSLAVVAEDGTLWLGGSFSERFLSPSDTARARTELVRFGDHSDWRQVEFLQSLGLVALDASGVIVKWDPWNVVGVRTRDARVPGSLPSEYANWIGVGRRGNSFFALATDGALCVWGNPDGDRFGHYLMYGHDLRFLGPSRLVARKLADLAP